MNFRQIDLASSSTRHLVLSPEVSSDMAEESGPPVIMLPEDRTNHIEPASIVDIVNRWAKAEPDRPVFHFLQDGQAVAEVLSCGDLDQKARAIAARLQRYTQVGDRVLLIYPPSLDFIPALFGCFFAGAIAVPCFAPRFEGMLTDVSPVRGIAKDCEPRALLSGGASAEQVLAACKETPALGNTSVLVTERIPKSEANRYQPPTIDRHTMAFLQYTSGSTESPKGVIATHGNLLSNLEAMEAAFFHQATVGVTWLPVYHDMGLIGTVLHSAYAAMPLYLMSPLTMLKHPIRWLEAISRYRADICAAPNFAYDYCVQRISPEQKSGLDLSSWKIACNGAEPVRAGSLERFAEAFASCGFRPESFYPCYGLAEATLFVSGGDTEKLPVVRTFRADSLQSGTARATDVFSDLVIPTNAPFIVSEARPSDTESKTQALVGCGRAWTDHEILVVEPQLCMECASGNIGEIWVRGPSVSQGYWNRPEQTRETFYGVVADDGRGPYLRTGDLGFFDRGELYLCGRMKDLIIIRGQNHYPQDIEETVRMCHPVLWTQMGVAFSCSIDGEERLVFAQEADLRAGELESDELKTLIVTAISEHHQLQAHAVLIVRRRTLPKTTSGKIRRAECRLRYLTNQLDLEDKLS